MTEDMAAQMRLMVTVVMVTMVVASALNLSAVAISMLASGSTSLISATQRISEQEEKRYDQKTIYGYEVKSAINLFSTRDMAIVIRTTKVQKDGTPWAFVYGSLLTNATIDSGNASGTVYKLASTMTKPTGKGFYSAELMMNSGSVQTCDNITGLTTTGDNEYILDSGRFYCELIKNASDVTIGIMFEQRASS